MCTKNVCMRGENLVYKVLMVDDEPMALEGLKYVIDWESLGFSICDTCENGREAVNAIDKHKPDVVITDIKMPIMDGLELIRYVREREYGKINFIIMSGYGEFECAKKAMQYGVRYYIQKPILTEDIYDIVIELKEQLDQMLKNKRNEEMDRKAILEGIMGDLLLGSDSKRAFEYLKSYLDENTLIADWNCIVLELRGSEEVDVDDELKRIRLQARKAIDEVLKNNSEAFILEQSLNKFIILASLKNDNQIDIIAERIHEKLITVVSSGFTIGVGENVSGISSIEHSYSTALEALEHRFYRDVNSLIFYNEIKDETFNYEFKDFFMINKIIEVIEEINFSKVKAIIDTTFDYFKAQRIDRDIVIMFTSNMISKINKLLYQSDQKEKNFLDNHTIREIKDHEKTLRELKEFLESFCMVSCEHLRKRKRKNSGSNTEKIEEFIKQNYKRNITIRELSERLYMHPAYLGQLFIQKFGVGFNEYIHELRIEEAKRLIHETELKNHEIAQELGYSNYNYFLQQFQRHTGMKPSEFRSTLN